MSPSNSFPDRKGTHVSRDASPVVLPMRPRSLVLHADDFGMSPEVNRGIVDGFQNGLLTSTSVLANAPAVTMALAQWNELDLRRRHRVLASDALRRSLRDPWLPFDLGAHLNLTQGRPLTAGYPTELLDSEGRFPGVFRLFFRSMLPVRRSLVAAVEAELESQIELLLDHGAPLGHLNGHQYIECLPLVSRIVPHLAERYTLRAVRVANEPGLTGTLLREGRPLGCVLALIKRLFAIRWRGQARRNQLATPDCYFGTAHAGEVSLDVLCGYLREATGEFVEVGLHPGRGVSGIQIANPDGLASNSSIVDGWTDPLASGRPRELAMLASPELAIAIVRAGFQLGRLSQLRETVAARQREAA